MENFDLYFPTNLKMANNPLWTDGAFDTGDLEDALWAGFPIDNVTLYFLISLKMANNSLWPDCAFDTGDDLDFLTNLKMEKTLSNQDILDDEANNAMRTDGFTGIFQKSGTNVVTLSYDDFVAFILTLIPAARKFYGAKAKLNFPEIKKGNCNQSPSNANTVESLSRDNCAGILPDSNTIESTGSCFLETVDGMLSSCRDEPINVCTTNDRDLHGAAVGSPFNEDIYIRKSSPQRVALPNAAEIVDGETVKLNSFEQKPLVDFDVHQSGNLVFNLEKKGTREELNREGLTESVLSSNDSTEPNLVGQEQSSSAASHSNKKRPRDAAVGKRINLDISEPDFRQHVGCCSSEDAAESMPPFIAPQDTRLVTVKATYGDSIIKFKLPLTSGITELNEEVAMRLNLELDNFNVEYKDEDGDWILIPCDKDLRDYLQLFSSLVNPVIRLLVVDKVVNANESSGSCKRKRP